MTKKCPVRKVVRGCVEGPALVCPASFSFLGDVDMATGEIIAVGNPNLGISLKGKILLYKETKGSSGGCMVLMTLARLGIGPLGIITENPADYNMTEGAILAKVPFVCSPANPVLDLIRTGDHIRLDADAGLIEFQCC